MTKTRAKSKYFLDKKHLYACVVRDKEAGVLSEELAKMLMLIATKYSMSPKWSGYTFLEDMVSVATLQLIRVWHKFDADRSVEAFSYYTTVCHNSFLHFLKAEKKQSDIRDTELMYLGKDGSLRCQIEIEQQRLDKQNGTKAFKNVYTKYKK